jgi:magnesium transporter
VTDDVDSAGPREAGAEEHFLDPARGDAALHELVQLFQSHLRDGRDAELAEVARELPPGDLSEVLGQLRVEETTRVLRRLSPDLLTAVLAELDDRSRSALFQLLDVDEIADLLEEMPSDEATDLLGALEDQAQAQEILAAMAKEEREDVAELLRYGPETAGGLMGKEVIAVPRDASCADAVAAVRRLDEDDLEQAHEVFVVDEEERLQGRVSLVRLLLARPEAPVREIMEAEPLYVTVDLDQEKVAQFFQTHDLVSLPVIDEAGRLVGRITVDDIFDVYEEEVSEDFSRLAGTGVEELGERSSLRVARTRLPWLLGAMVGEFGSMLVLRHYHARLETMVALAFFIPVIMAMGGNTGVQTSSVVVRGLATGELSVFRLWRHLLRELLTALLTGAMLAVCLYLVAGVVIGDRALATVLGVAMLAVVVIAALVGSAVPMFLQRWGIDPAVATGPFITTANDVLGLLIYLSLASLLLR